MDVLAGKRCTMCHEVRAVTEFYQRSDKPARGNRCKQCMRLQARHRTKNPAHKAREFERRLWMGYGLTVADYHAMYEAQGGKCAICGVVGELAKGASRRDVEQLVVDHDHETGMVRGLLCNLCNTGIGSLRHSVERLSAASVYLQTTPLHAGSPATPFPRKVYTRQSDVEIPQQSSGRHDVVMLAKQSLAATGEVDISHIAELTGYAPKNVRKRIRSAAKGLGIFPELGVVHRGGRHTVYTPAVMRDLKWRIYDDLCAWAIAHRNDPGEYLSYKEVSQRTGIPYKRTLMVIWSLKEDGRLDMGGLPI